MQDTHGVVAVQLVDLYFSHEEIKLESVLKGNLARWQNGTLLPAQMLLVNTQTGITLETEVVA